MSKIQPRNANYITPLDFNDYQSFFQGDLLSSYQLEKLGRINPLDANCSIPTGSDLTNEELDLVVKNVTFVVTEKCNLACTYCYETHKTNARMTKEVAKAAVDMMLEQEKVKDYYDLNKTPAVILDFIGGEPLLEIDLMDYIVEYFKFKTFELDHPWQYNYMISISTNGTLYLSKKVQQFLARNKDRVSTTISIDGNKKLHDTCRVYRNGKGSYDIVERSVKQWVKDNDGRAQTKATIAHENVPYMVESFKHLFEELGVTGGISNFVYDKGWEVPDSKIGYDNLKALADWLCDEEGNQKYFLSYFDESIGKQAPNDDNFCGGNGGMLAFSAEGQATPCLRFLKYTLNRKDEQVIGNVWDGLEWNKENEWLNLLTNVTRVSQSPPKCLQCPVTSGCGRCTAMNYDYTGSPDIKATHACKMHRARVLANVYYWNKVYRRYNEKRRFAMNMPISWALEIIDEDEYWMLCDLAKEDF